MADSLPLRIFIASPGDLGPERVVVRECVDEYNAGRSVVSGIRYDTVGWERVRGTARRPQDAINELISESHFMIVLFRRSWGSAPGGSWGFTSGTEEELFTGLVELGQPDRHMRDVWVSFMDDPSPADEIVNLREQMKDRHSVMYESIVDVPELKEKLANLLETWESLAGAKTPRHIDLLPSSGSEVLKAANLRIQGEKLIALGQTEAGLDALRKAAGLGGPSEHLTYARFLARRGELDAALLATEHAIKHFSNGLMPLYSPLAAESFAAQAGVLRRQGRTVEAVGRLEQALTLVVGQNDAYAQAARCRILDELGLALHELGDLDRARGYFAAALKIREASRSGQDLCQSKVNLARLEVRAGNLVAAAALADEVVAILRGTPATSLHANAEALAAQIRLREGRPRQGIPHAEWALALNQQMANSQGQAIALLLLAQCCRADGRPREAREHAIACIELNQAMGNDSGAQRAQWILDQLDDRQCAEES